MKKSYFEWLHELTVFGYDKNVMINTEHGQFIEKMFMDGLTPNDALERYIDFKED